MKRCSLCLLEKSLSEFNKKGNGLSARCKACLAAYYSSAYRDNPERRRQVVSAIARRREKLSEFVDELKRGPCADCSMAYSPWVMHFDHLPGHSKTVDVSTAVKYGWSKKRILTEIAKCELVCANCHAERTHQRLSHSGGIVQPGQDAGLSRRKRGFKSRYSRQLSDNTFLQQHAPMVQLDRAPVF